MKVLKRDGTIVPFDKNKIISAISRAGYVDETTKNKIALEIEGTKAPVIPVETIQDMVERKLMVTAHKDVAREYIRYRYKRELIRGNDKLHRNILEIVEHTNEYVNTENSNKNPQLLSTQRDYMAGEVSKDLSYKVLLPTDVVQAHQAGIIHFHNCIVA